MYWELPLFGCQIILVHPPCNFHNRLWSWGYYSVSKDGVRDSRRYRAEFELSPFHFKPVLCGFRTAVLKQQRQSCPIYWDICILAKFVIECIFFRRKLYFANDLYYTIWDCLPVHKSYEDWDRVFLLIFLQTQCLADRRYSINIC